MIHEFKSCARDFDSECIYCKYSQYAMRESAKVAVNNGRLENGSGEGMMDPRVDNLVKMF